MCPVCNAFELKKGIIRVIKSPKSNDDQILSTTSSSVWLLAPKKFPLCC